MVKTKEQMTAELLEKLEGVEGWGGTIDNRLKTLEQSVDGFKANQVDAKQVGEDLAQIKATQQQLRTLIRTNRGGAYVPGLEDEAERFNLVRAFTAMKRSRKDDWSDVGAQRELEVLKAVKVKAAQSIGEDTLGGYFVPDQVIPDVIQAVYTQSVFVNLDGLTGETNVSVIGGLTGGNVKIPRFDGGCVAFWIGEEAAFTETLAKVGDVNMNPKKAGALIKMTDAYQRFAGYGLDRLVRRDLSAALAKLVDRAVMYGKGGDDEPRGIAYNQDIKLYSAQSGNTLANTAAAVTAENSNAWTGAELDFDGLDAMKLALEEDDISPDASTRYIFAPRYRRRVASLKVSQYATQTLNFGYLLGSPMLNDARLAEIIGPFSKWNQMPTKNKAGATVNATPSGGGTSLVFTDILFGRMSEVLLGRWGGIEVEDDAGKGTGFATDHTFLKIRMYCDVGFRQPRAIILCPDAKARGALPTGT